MDNADSVQRCEHEKWSGWGMGPQCDKTAKVERDGKHYCGVHDPVARKERQAARDVVTRQRWEARNKARPIYTAEQYAALQAKLEAAERREQALQRALDRWLPEIAGDDSRGPMYAAASEDSLLLMGLREGTECYGQQIMQRAEAAERDAARYRWLCEPDNASVRLLRDDAQWLDTLDAAIDAAIDAQRQEVGNGL